MSKEIQTQPLPDFDWDKAADKGFGTGYSTADRDRFEQMYETTISPVQEKEVVKGIVVGITDREVILNIGFKSDGIVSSNEFRDLPGMKIGDEVEVYVENQEDAQGQLVLSRKKAKVITAWDNIQKSFDEDVVIDANVKRRTKGGLIVDIFGIEAFLPGSQIDVKPIRDFDIFVGKRMEVKVVKINYANDNVVVSHKILIEKDLEAQRQQILNNLEKGQVLEGVIKNMTNFGVFIDLGGVDGLLHITDISWGRINHPSDLLALDQKLNVVVLDFDEEKKRISLGLKQLQSHPWDSLAEEIQVGSKVTGRIVNVADYGAFLEIKPGVEGLIHVSEMSWSQHLRNPQEFMNVNDEISAVVLTLDRNERKMSLGIKQLTEDPWTQASLKDKYAIGTRHKGVVRNLTNFGLFIELEEGIDGLVHVSDLSWTKKIKHPSDFVKVNDELEVVVLELDADNRRLALGHKQLEENPWDTFESIFEVGSVHKSTIVAKGDKFATLELPYGIEGVSAIKNLTKEDGTVAEVGESLDFTVLEFLKDEKKIVLTHSKVTKAAPAPEEKKEDRPAKAQSSAPAKSAPVADSTKEGEKSTFGDLSVLSALKEQMEESEKKGKK
ncbi:30S ribosomal protein S1 [Dyadobacter chenwenxiniae]|uniref:Small ribosomal subunit protein bS1 n=1 Tax=Dyadobacter chenwenxiniae TaxID=2906456 RepID=A0A9X1TNF1_9BACT|nr:30S ribosomal protein S1 [Dyadobacter chenwenxiniae]MCF0051180.1 30S ribosomal protein S1 [Dyadobacter chenwenxiniae]MCF0064498.1 30S ribosomal protein S1 [Dyadobacter chenwenxiniae]UON82299.1 30S ribosomal protein S1 [Dyadobacter chenwenxiniae]